MNCNQQIQRFLTRMILVVVTLLAVCLTGSSQFNVHIEVYDPANKSEIFIAGTFNDWNPGDSAYKLKNIDRSHKFIDLKISDPGEYQFKFTRGSWSKAECGPTGVAIENRVVAIKSDTAIHLKIAGWHDDFFIDAPFTVRFDVVVPNRQGEIFVAGSFNFWDPGNPGYKLQDIDPAHKFIVLRLNSGKHLFKFTRGTWGTVESNENGFSIDDRVVEINGDTTIQLAIKAWNDDYFELSKLPDTTRIVAYWSRSFFYQQINLDSSYKYAMASFELSQKISDKLSQVTALNMLATVFEKRGNPDKALELLLQAMRIATPLKDSSRLAGLYFSIGTILKSEKEFTKAKTYFQNVLNYMPENNLIGLIRPGSALSLGQIYFTESNLDSAAFYAKKSSDMYSSGSPYLLLGDIEKKRGNKNLAMINYRQAVAAASIVTGTSSEMAEIYGRLAVMFTENAQADSGFLYARKSLSIAKQVNDPFIISSASSLMSKLFESERRFDSAFYYQQIVTKTNDSLFDKEKQKQIHQLVFNEQLHQQEITAEREKFRSRTWIYTLLGGLLVLLLTAVLLIRNNTQKKKANVVLEKQKRQIEIALSDLKATQSQLVHSAKMASLGELTAGVAHEIQNPLNFVTNFSEINDELIDEVRQELATGNMQQVNKIVDNIKHNLEKINHHGKRADAIVKGMLQHSRTSSGQKELTDINALAAEYLRLAYHGFRAKDKSFNAKYETMFDNSIGKINIVPQDIGRVILNLVNNAFFAASAKASDYAKASTDELATADGASQAPLRAGEGRGAVPTVWVSTKKDGDKILISVKDNGTGIPENIIDKIFQPFFTTKPTGQGTGLGLSLAYDIVKAHGGEIKVETQKGEARPDDPFGRGSEFIILIPGS